jgi:hypothetical protein
MKKIADLLSKFNVTFHGLFQSLASSIEQFGSALTVQALIFKEFLNKIFDSQKI